MADSNADSNHAETKKKKFLKLGFKPTLWEPMKFVKPGGREEIYITFVALISIIPTKKRIDPTTGDPEAHSASGAFCLEAFMGTQATRLVCYDNDDYPCHIFYLPTDTSFSISTKKLAGKVTSRGLVITMDFGPEEPNEVISLTIAYEGGEDCTATLVLKAFEHIQSMIDASIHYFEKQEEKAANAAARALARRRESYVSLDSIESLKSP